MRKPTPEPDKKPRYRAMWLDGGLSIFRNLASTGRGLNASSTQPVEPTWTCPRDLRHFKLDVFLLGIPGSHTSSLRSVPNNLYRLTSIASFMSPQNPENPTASAHARRLSDFRSRTVICSLTKCSPKLAYVEPLWDTHLMHDKTKRLCRACSSTGVNALINNSFSPVGMTGFEPATP